MAVVMNQHASEGQTNQEDIIGALPELESVQSVNITINLSGPRSTTCKGLMSSPSNSSAEGSTYEWYGTPRRSLSSESHHSSMSSGTMANDSYSVALTKIEGRDSMLDSCALCDHCHISPPSTAVCSLLLRAVLLFSVYIMN